MSITDFNGKMYIIKHISMIGEVQQGYGETGKFYFDFDCGGVTHTISDYDQAVVIDFQDNMNELVTKCVKPTYAMRVSETQ